MPYAVSTLTEAMVVCPMCNAECDDVIILPCPTPCCDQSSLQECSCTYIRGSARFACPLGRVDVNHPCGAKSLPKDRTFPLLKNVIKTSRANVPFCIDCKDANKPMATRGIKTIMHTSQMKDTDFINKIFDDIVEDLNQRRSILLSKLEFRADRELKSIRRVHGLYRVEVNQKRLGILQDHTGQNEVRYHKWTFSILSSSPDNRGYWSRESWCILHGGPRGAASVLHQVCRTDQTRHLQADTEAGPRSRRSSSHRCHVHFSPDGPHQEFDHSTSSDDEQIFLGWSAISDHILHLRTQVSEESTDTAALPPASCCVQSMMKRIHLQHSRSETATILDCIQQQAPMHPTPFPTTTSTRGCDGCGPTGRSTILWVFMTPYPGQRLNNGVLFKPSTKAYFARKEWLYTVPIS